MQRVDSQAFPWRVERSSPRAKMPLPSTPIPTRLPTFSMAYQPIVNIDRLDVFAYEALVRSHNNKEDARGVLDCVPPTSSYAFHLASRSHAIRMAIELDIQQSDAKLCLNINPTAAIQDASHLGLTCTEAIASGMPLDRLIMELAEEEEIKDPVSLRVILGEYQRMGIKIALDDFGSGYAGLKLLAILQPDLIKLDISLVSRVATERPTEIILSAIVSACFDLGVAVVAEGVENYEVSMRMREMGVTLQQGYYFSRPAFEQLPTINWHGAMSAPSSKLRTRRGLRTVS